MKIKEKIVSAIREKQPEVIAVYLFGSAGTKYETSDSDVDVAILLPEKMNMDDRLSLINMLIDALHKDKIDLIDLRDAPTVLKFQIMMNGQRIFCSDIFQGDSFEMYTFSDYVRLNEERRAILDAIQQRGSVF